MIEIFEFKEFNKPFHKATVSIKVPKWGNFRIKRIKVFEKEGNRWISLPSEEYEKEGKKKYFPLNDFETQEMNDAFRNTFFKVFDEYKEKTLNKSNHEEQINIPF